MIKKPKKLKPPKAPKSKSLKSLERYADRLKAVQKQNSEAERKYASGLKREETLKKEIQKLKSK